MYTIWIDVAQMRMCESYLLIKKGHELWPSHYLQQTLKNINLFKAAKYLTQQLVER